MKKMIVSIIHKLEIWYNIPGFEVSECYRLRPVVQSETKNFWSGTGNFDAFLQLNDQIF